MNPEDDVLNQDDTIGLDELDEEDFEGRDEPDEEEEAEDEEDDITWGEDSI